MPHALDSLAPMTGLSLLGVFEVVCLMPEGFREPQTKNLKTQNGPKMLHFFAKFLLK